MERMAKPAARTTRVHTFLSIDELAALDLWRRQQADLPSRSEAIRRALARVTGKGDPQKAKGRP